jgi:hypothetical protein
MTELKTPHGTIVFDADRLIWEGFSTPDALDWLDTFADDLYNFSCSRYVSLFPELCDPDSW